MSEPNIDIQLKVWKDLALSKQVLMGAATDALGLDASCSSKELKQALQQAIQKTKEADINIKTTREKADAEIAEMKKQMDASNQARIEAEAKIAAAETARETAERQLTIGREENSKAIKKARAEANEKENKLKAISKALADTPENVIKKLKNLKKQKLDESNLRKQTETKLKEVRKEKTALEAELEQHKALAQKSATLVEQLRELHDLCKDQNKKIKSLSEDKKDHFKIPKIDEELLKSLEQANSQD